MVRDDERWAELLGSAALRAAVDRVIPADDWPAGWAGGVGAYLQGSAAELAWATPALERLLWRLHQARFVKLSAAGRDSVLDGLAARPDSAQDFAVLRRLCWEGFYAQTRLPAASGPGDWHVPAGLTMIGFQDVPTGIRRVESQLPTGLAPEAVRDHYDAVVIGSGPGGGVAAQVLAIAGHSVLVVERARRVDYRWLRGDHLHGKRNAVYSPTVGPGPGHPRIAADGALEWFVDGDGDAFRYGLNAFAYGGGTRIWQGMAWRFFPEDFVMASHYGNPAGATLADWPIGYDDLEPFY